MKTLGEILRDARVEKDLSLRMLSSKIGISPIYISDIENDKVIPTKGKAIEALSKFLKIKSDEIVKLAEQTKFIMKSREVKQDNQYKLKMELARSIMQENYSLDEEKMKDIINILNKGDD